MGPLKGFKIIEVSGIGPGPFCGMLLADLGAEVIRIDRSSTALPISSSHEFDITGRNKKSICLNLKNPKSKDVFFKLIKESDALIEGFRPGVMEKLGLGPDECISKNKKLVYGRITGWGQSGPLSKTAGHDINYIALAGALYSMNGTKPAIPLNLVGDYGGGSMFLAFGLCAALLSVSKTGVGQVVDAAMVDGISTLMSIFYSLSQSNLWDVDKRGENLFDGGAHFYQTYKTKDDKFISFGSLEPQFYEIIKSKLNLDKSFDNQFDKKKWNEMSIGISKIIETKAQSEWNEIFKDTDACYAPVLSINETHQNNHMIERNSFIKINDVIQPSPSPRFSITKSEEPVIAPKVGENNDEILIKLGYTDKEIEELKDLNVLD
jgi:alpha-methylacyl-CoA racemase